MKRRTRRRTAISLLEVIAVTMLVSILMIPIADVMRSSAKAIARSTGAGSPEAQARRSLRWLCDEIRRNKIQSVAGNGQGLRLDMPGGRTATVAIRRGRLVINDGVGEIVLSENARGFRVQETRVVTGGPLIGIRMELTLRDPATKVDHVVPAVLSI